MSYAANILNPKIEKHSLVVLRPRKRLLGWSLFSGGAVSHDPAVWVADYSLADINRIWARQDDAENWIQVAALPTNDKEWFYDKANGKVYVFTDTGNGPEDPDSSGIVNSFQSAYGPTALGLTIEVNFYVSDSAFPGPSDPMDATSDPVDWLPVLNHSPSSMLGSRQALFGFNPLNDSALEIQNQDAWLQPYLYAFTFNLAEVRSYVMADKDIENAASNGNTKEIYRGFLGQPKCDVSGRVSIPCFDFLAFLDRTADPVERFSLDEFPLVDPRAVKPGQEYFIRNVRGMVDDHVPVNIDYNAVAATNVNRDFATHAGTGVDGSYGANVDTANGGNSATKTYLLTTPKVNIGDSIIIVKGGVDRYTIVTNVDRAGKNITHGVIAGVFAGGDSILRYDIGWVKIRDSDGAWHNLFASRNFTRINKATLGNAPDWLGFRLADNFEADIGFPETFDPAKHQIVCRVYGTQALEKYVDTVTDVGAISDEGGVASNGISLLHWLLKQSGLPEELLDQTSFSAVATNHQLGLAIPAGAEESTAPTFRALIQLVLQSLIWKLVYVDNAGEVAIGLLETGPFVGTSFSVDDNDFREFGFEHDYSSMCSRVVLEYGAKEFSRINDLDIFLAAVPLSVADGTQVAVADNLLARDLHLIAAEFQPEGGILQFLVAEAQVIADRYAFALGDRRAYYSITVGADFLGSAALGSTYALNRQQMPGTVLELGEDQTQSAIVIESTKAAHGVTLVLEDQKGIQDNAGVWP